MVGNFGRCVPEYLRAFAFLLLLRGGGIRGGLTQPSESPRETDTSDYSRTGIGAGLIMKEPSSWYWALRKGIQKETPAPCPTVDSRPIPPRINSTNYHVVGPTYIPDHGMELFDTRSY